jgi:hypothetical protein
MSKVRRIALAVVLTGAVIGIVAPAAQASGGCVSRSEFRRVHNGMAKTQVSRIFGTGGRQSSLFTIGGDRYESREYEVCGSTWGFASVDYENNRVSGKLVLWG